MVAILSDDDSHAPLKSKNTNFPPIPRRGRVTAHIFESLAKTFVTVAFKAGGNPKGNRGGDGGDATHHHLVLLTPIDAKSD